MGCSILFHLARRGLTNTVLVEKESLGAGSTGRSSGIVRMHYSSEVNARIAFASLETIRDFQELCQDLDVTVERAVSLDSTGRVSAIGKIGPFANLRSREGIFLLRRQHAPAS